MKPGAAPLYLDTSCLLKLFFREPESARVAELLASEASVVVSELARLEAETQLRARQLGGSLTKARHSRLAAQLQSVLASEPFTLAPVPHDTFERARAIASRSRVHARTLDLLHVATMESLEIERLLTNDATQAAVARSLAFEVLAP